MAVWQFCLCVAFALVIAEILAPFTFFLSMAIGAFITAIVAVWVVSKYVLIPVFAVCSLLALLVFRPFLAKNSDKNTKDDKTGIGGQYMGKIVKVIQTVTSNSGAIAVYGERWEARSLNENETFEEGEDVEIAKNESLTMYVQKVNR